MSLYSFFCKFFLFCNKSLSDCLWFIFNFIFCIWKITWLYLKLSDLFVSDCKQAPTANGTISLFGGLCMEMVDKVFPSLWQCASVEHNAHILITLKDPPPHFCLPTFAYFPRFLPFFFAHFAHFFLAHSLPISAFSVPTSCPLLATTFFVTFGSFKYFFLATLDHCWAPFGHFWLLDPFFAHF